MKEKGQALVEFALIAPLLFFMILAQIGLGFKDQKVHDFQTALDVITELAAQTTDESWHSQAVVENTETDCNASPVVPEAEYLSIGNHQIVRLTWHCHLHTRWIFDGYPINVQSEAVVHE